MGLVGGIKAAWHRDLVRDPVVHGWVLNLYRMGERYPKTVCDYFPSRFAPTAELAGKLIRHREEEARHEAVFERALERLGQPVSEFPADDVFNHHVRSFTPTSFAIEEADAPAVRRRKLAHFMAHAHFLESRIARSLRYHHEACLAEGRTDVARGVALVLRDEERHAGYTREEVDALLPRAEAVAVLDEHRRAEARANLSFSSRQVRAYLARYGDCAPRRRRLLYRLCALVMEGAASRV